MTGSMKKGISEKKKKRKKAFRLKTAPVRSYEEFRTAFDPGPMRLKEYI